MPWLHPTVEQQEPLQNRSPEQARQRMRALSARCRLGQWGLFLFLLLSLLAFRAIPWFAAMPPSWRRVLGPPPPVRLISIALAIYAFAALIHILARMMEGGTRYRGWSHVGYTCGFYLFYGYAGGLADNFWAVFVAGLTILGLEYYRLWTHCNEALTRERRMLRESGGCRPGAGSDGEGKGRNGQ